MNALPLFFDGAIGTLLLNLGFKDCFPILNLKYPELIKNIHLKYIKSGANIIKTNTFNADLNSLKICNAEKKIYEINDKAVKLVKEAVDLSNMKEKIFIAGDIGPSIKRYYETDENLFIKSAYLQTKSFIENNVDFVLLETMVSLYEIKLLLKGILNAFYDYNKKIKIIVSITPDKNGNFVFDGNFEELKKIKEIDYLGLNCGSGCQSFKRALKKADFDFLAPSLGIPEYKNNSFFYTKSPFDFFREIKGLNINKISFIGACCGTNPNFMRDFFKILKSDFES